MVTLTEKKTLCRVDDLQMSLYSFLRQFEIPNTHFWRSQDLSVPVFFFFNFNKFLTPLSKLANYVGIPTYLTYFKK